MNNVWVEWAQIEPVQLQLAYLRATNLGLIDNAKNYLKLTVFDLFCLDTFNNTLCIKQLNLNS